jgi:hypothetical protein
MDSDGNLEIQCTEEQAAYLAVQKGFITSLNFDRAVTEAQGSDYLDALSLQLPMMESLQLFDTVTNYSNLDDQMQYLRNLVWPLQLKNYKSFFHCASVHRNFIDHMVAALYNILQERSHMQIATKQIEAKKWKICQGNLTIFIRCD